jgi:hypothetical protein
MLMKDWIALIPGSVSALTLIASVVWALVQYRKQRRDAFVEGRQANRSRLTEAYMNWHQMVLSSEKNIEVSAKYIRIGYDIIGRDGQLTVHQASYIHLIYSLLNALYLEWNYRKTYMPNHMTEFNKTVDHILSGMVGNLDPAFKRIMDNFGVVFFDFDEEFKNVIRERIDAVRKNRPVPIASSA